MTCTQCHRVELVENGIDEFMQTWQDMFTWQAETIGH